MRWKGLHIILCVLLFASCGKKVDWTFSADKNSTQPFGLFLAYDRLDDLYPYATKKTVYDLMKEVNRTSNYYNNKNKVLISVSGQLFLSVEEFQEIYDYVDNGGQLILLSQYFSRNMDSVFNLNSVSDSYGYKFKGQDTLSAFQILWEGQEQFFKLNYLFNNSHFEDAEQWTPIGHMDLGKVKNPNLLKRTIGKGEIIVGIAPEMITNYAMLQDSNVNYYEKLFSHFSKKTNRVTWFSKYSVYPKRDSRNKSNFMKLLEEPSYRYAFLVLLLLAIVFLIFETRRRQRIVAVVPPVTNDSLAFTELIGKLYYGEKDHKNLSQKMIQYYLEHIRTTYNIPTTHLNKSMADKLARKLNKTTEDTEKFINYLNTQLTAMQLSEADIKQLYITLKKYS